jgi:hypothetical protein
MPRDIASHARLRRPCQESLPRRVSLDTRFECHPPSQAFATVHYTGGFFAEMHSLFDDSPPIDPDAPSKPPAKAPPPRPMSPSAELAPLSLDPALPPIRGGVSTKMTAAGAGRLVGLSASGRPSGRDVMASRRGLAVLSPSDAVRIQMPRVGVQGKPAGLDIPTSRGGVGLVGSESAPTLQRGSRGGQRAAL